MVTVSTGEETFEVHPRVQLDWGPHESDIRESIPLARILMLEKIALNAAWVRRNVQLEEIDGLEALMDIDSADLENQ